MIIQPSDDAIRKAAQLLKRGGVLAVPTETVYGLAANALNSSAVAEIFRMKGRPSSNPLIVHVASLDALSLVVDCPLPALVEARLKKASVFWPGPLSLVMPRNPQLPDSVTAGLATVAVRIPDHPVALKLLRAAGIPLAAPSANPSGRPSPTTALHVDEGFGGEITVLDGGPCKIGLESTVLAISGTQPLILRPGAVTRAQLEKCLGERVAGAEQPQKGETPSSPGMLFTHYAPKTRVVLRGSLAGSALPPRVGLISFSSSGCQDAAGRGYAATVALSESGDLEEIARQLFAALHDFDKLSLDLIEIDCCAEEGLGAAIMDRINRAIAGHTNIKGR